MCIGIFLIISQKVNLEESFTSVTLRVSRSGHCRSELNYCLLWFKGRSLFSWPSLQTFPGNLNSKIHFYLYCHKRTIVNVLFDLLKEETKSQYTSCQSRKGFSAVCVALLFVLCFFSEVWGQWTPETQTDVATVPNLWWTEVTRRLFLVVALFSHHDFALKPTTKGLPEESPEWIYLHLLSSCCRYITHDFDYKTNKKRCVFG